jgi:4-aminobutyrate aminotransferase-like enzyme
MWTATASSTLMAGIAVSSTGHSHPEVVQAVKDQADKFFNMCGHVFYNQGQAEYAERLTKLAPIKGNGKNRVFFCNSGAEAWEGAIKLARYKTKAPERDLFLWCVPWPHAGIDHGERQQGRAAPRLRPAGARLLSCVLSEDV